MKVNKEDFIKCLGEAYGVEFPPVIELDLPHIRRHFDNVCVFVSEAHFVEYKGKKFVVNGRLHIYPDKNDTADKYRGLDGLTFNYQGAPVAVSFMKESTAPDYKGALIFAFGHNLTAGPFLAPVNAKADQEAAAIMEEFFVVRNNIYDPTPWL